MSIEHTKYLRELRQNMVKYFDLDELQTLSLDLSIDWEELPGDNGKTSKCRSFIMHLAQRGRLSELVTLLREERNHVEWPDVPAPEQQVIDEASLIPDSVREALLLDFLEKMNQEFIGKDLIFDNSVRALVRAYVYTVRLRLDVRRMAIVLRFLSESDLVDRVFFDLDGCDLHGAYLYETNLSLMGLNGANLNGANLSRTNLSEVRLSGANLNGAMSDADLSDADLSDANLSGANLKRAYLDRTNLSGACLVEADLHEAKLKNTSFRGADLSGASLLMATYLNSHQLSQARLLRGAIMPDGTSYEEWINAS